MIKELLNTPWPSIIWTGLIFFLLTISAGSMESTPKIPIPNLDKIVHFFLFATFSWLLLEWRSASASPDFVLLVLVALASAGYGTGMEFYQEYFTTRAFEVADICADSLGAILPSIWWGAKKSPYGNRGRNQN